MAPPDQFSINYLAHDVAEVILAPDVYLDVSVTDMVNSELLMSYPEQKFYIVCEASGAYVVSPELRHALTQSNSARRVKAVAFYSNNTDGIEREQTITRNLQFAIPVRFFDNKAEALAWLHILKTTAGERIAE